MKTQIENENNKKVIILIPSLEPNEKLLSYVDELKNLGFMEIIIVDDGSGKNYQPIFNKLNAHGCVVLHHEENKGKGAALKTGFMYIKENYSHFSCVVTADSDGQHAVEDVVKVSELSKNNSNSLTLGVRDFTTPGVPPKSLLGNRIATFVFAALYGKRLPDTQTGLRAFGSSLLPFMLKVRGSRFEYEIQMLIACVQKGILIQTIPIQVIYENANEGTHFKPIRDSVKIIGTLFSNFIRFLVSSFASAALDLGIAWFLMDFLSPFFQSEYGRILTATIVARIISIVFNYILNKKFVFQERNKESRSLIRYLILCWVIILLSATGVYGLHKILGINEKIGKLICDALLFLLSYQVQQRWVFVKGEKANNER